MYNVIFRRVRATIITVEKD